jgi:hypothetical protein
MTEQQVAVQRQGAVIGGWVCIALGAALMFWTLFSFLLYLPLFLAAFVLGIVAIAQRRLGHGIPILLLSVVIPLVVGVGLGAYRAQQVMEDVHKTDLVLSAPQDSRATPEAADSKPATPPGPSTEQQYIVESLELYDFKARYMNAVLDGRVPGVTFKIKNNGDRSLERVKVVVFFKDAAGSVIAEEDYVPVSVSKYNLSGDNKPLKPGYIWQQERGKFYTAKSIPSEWKEGAAEAKITEIRFEDDKS